MSDCARLERLERMVRVGVEKHLSAYQRMMGIVRAERRNWPIGILIVPGFEPDWDMEGLCE